MARTVADAAALLAAMAGADPDDPATRRDEHWRGRGGRRRRRSPRTEVTATRSIRRPERRAHRRRPQQDVRLQPRGRSTRRRGDRRDEEAGRDDGRSRRTSRRSASSTTSEFEVLLYEFKADLNKYLTWLGAASPVHSLKEVIAFNDAHKDQEMPYFGQEILAMAEKKGPLTDAEVQSPRSRANRQHGRSARHRCGDDGAQTRRAGRADRRAGRGSPTSSTATVRSANAAGAVDRSRPSPAIRTSRCRPDSSADCRWEFRSSAAPGASRR